MDLVSYPLFMILATPFFVNRLGAEQYGLWMLLNVIVQVMNGLNFGVGDSTIRETARYEAMSDTGSMNAAFNRNLSLSCVLLVLCVLLAYVFGMFIRRFGLFNISPQRLDEALLALLLFALSAGLKFIEQVFVSVFKGMQRFDVSARLMMMSRLTTLGGAALVVYNGYGILEIVEASLVANVCCLLVQALVVYRYTSINEMMPRFHLADLGTLFRTNGWYWLQSVIALVGFLSDRLIIGYLTDLKTVGYYSIAALIGSQIHNILLAFGSFVFPKVAAYNMLNKSTRNVYYLSRFLIAVSGWTIIITLLLSGDVVFRWWLGEDTYLHAIGYIKLYLAFAAVILLIIIPFHFINGSAAVKLNSFFEAILRSTHIAGMILAYHFYGMTGLLWALILTTLVNIPMQYFLFHKIILGIREAKEAFLPVLPAIVVVCIAVSPLWAGLVLTGVFAWLVRVIYYDRISVFAAQLIKRRS